MKSSKDIILSKLREISDYSMIVMTNIRTGLQYLTAKIVDKKKDVDKAFDHKELIESSQLQDSQQNKSLSKAVEDYKNLQKEYDEYALRVSGLRTAFSIIKDKRDHADEIQDSLEEYQNEELIKSAQKFAQQHDLLLDQLYSLWGGNRAIYGIFDVKKFKLKAEELLKTKEEFDKLFQDKSVDNNQSMSQLDQQISNLNFKELEVANPKNLLSKLEGMSAVCFAAKDNVEKQINHLKYAIGEKKVKTDLYIPVITQQEFLKLKNGSGMPLPEKLQELIKDWDSKYKNELFSDEKFNLYKEISDGLRTYEKASLDFKYEKEQLEADKKTLFIIQKHEEKLQILESVRKAIEFNNEVSDLVQQKLQQADKDEKLIKSVQSFLAEYKIFVDLISDLLGKWSFFSNSLDHGLLSDHFDEISFSVINEKISKFREIFKNEENQIQVDQQIVDNNQDLSGLVVDQELIKHNDPFDIADMQ